MRRVSAVAAPGGVFPCPFVGMVLIQDSNGLPAADHLPNPDTVSAQANATETLSGLVYFPQTAVTFQGTPAASGPQCLCLSPIQSISREPPGLRRTGVRALGSTTCRLSRPSTLPNDRARPSLARPHRPKRFQLRSSGWGARNYPPCSCLGLRASPRTIRPLPRRCASPGLLPQCGQQKRLPSYARQKSGADASGPDQIRRGSGR